MAEDWTEKMAAELRASAVRRLTRVAIEATNDLKKMVSTAAPRKVSKKSGRVYAATKATPGAPPRKLTGRMRASLSYKVDKVLLNATVGTNVIYAPVHEFGTRNKPGGLHKFVEPTMKINAVKYERILLGGV